MKKLFFLIAFFIIINVLGQVNNCGVNNITVGASCSTTNWTVPSTYTNSMGNPSCATSYRDGWYTFTATSTSTTIEVANSNRAMGFAVYTGGCGSPTQITCQDAVAGTGLETATIATTIGQVYGIRIMRTNNANGNDMNGTICVYNGGSGPSNDLCTGATALPCGTTNLAGTTVGSTNVSDPASCASSYGVWYTFTGDGGSTTISATASGGWDHEMVVFSGACGSLTNITCQDAGFTNGTESYTFTTTNAVTYYVYIAHYSTSSTTTGTFTISRSCAAPPTCSADATINTTTYSGSGTTCGFGDDYDASDACSSSYMTGDDIVIAWTPNTTECVNINLSNTGTWTGVFVTDNCPNIGGASCLASNTNSSGNPSISGFNVTSGTTYYITVSTYPSPQCTAFDLDIVSCPAPPSNDECAGATAVTVNNDNTCTFTTAGTVAAATGSADGNTCFGTDDDDVWFSFVATSTKHYVDLLNVAGSTTDLYHVLYSGSCGSLTQLYCSDANTSTANGLTIGATYFIRVYSYTSTGGQNTTFDVCVNSDPPPVTACSGNFYDTGGAGGNYTNNEYYFQTFCSSVPGQCLVMTFSAFNTESCCDELNIYNGASTSASLIGTYAGTSLPNGGTITANSGCLTIEWDSDFSTVSSGWAATISCGACPAPTCSDGVQNGTETGVDCGGSCGACPVIGPCGNLNNNDWCSDPAVLTQGAGSWSSSTSNIYSYDDPGTSFCGSIENNSWYVFTASATTETFNFSNITNCIWNDGIQAEVFDVTTDGNGCCTSLSSVSNCWNPWSTANGTVTATGLTIGNDYYLMVDGWGGDQCDFTVTGWTATGILPVTLVSFDAYNYKEGNKLIWTTQSEVNNDYFIVQKSFDGSHFEDIEIIDGNGNSNNTITYEFYDNDIRFKVNYYRLKQIDFDGQYEYSKIIAVKNEDNIIVELYPNPSREKLFIDINQPNDEVYTIVYSNVIGEIKTEQLNMSKDINTYQLNIFKTLNSGIYFIKVVDSTGNTIQTEKIVKY